MACKQDLRPLVVSAASRYGVPSRVASAIADRESGTCHWNADGSVKVGSAGEIGVMQVEPATAPGVNLYDVNENIRAGVSFLAEMYRKFGSWALATAAYNWGPGNVVAAIAGNKKWPGQVLAYAIAVSGESPIGNQDVQYARNSVPAADNSPSILTLGVAGIGAAALLYIVTG